MSEQGSDRLWVVHIGLDDQVAVRAANEGFIAIGWTRMGDLSPYSTREAMRARMEEVYPDWKPKSVSASYGQVFRFAHEMEIGDWVVLPVKPTREIAVGRIAGPYRFAWDDTDLAAKDLCNVRPVAWRDRYPRTVFSDKALYSFGSALTVSRSDDHLEELLSVLSGADARESEDAESSIVIVGGAAESVAAVEASRAEEVRQTTEDHLIRAWTGTKHHFEHVVAGVFEAMGYYARVTVRSGDYGVDVIAHMDPVGVTPPLLKIQAKAGVSKAGGKDARELKGCLGVGEKGVLISLAGFSPQAAEESRSTPDLVLIDGPRFVELFLGHYDRLDPRWRTRYPLESVFVPAG
ncbi:MAG TPA: restriction endonuclease [Planctomycetota bacterium]|nr:restriction endonuclease [Planctomycetota bacterium]